MGHLCGTDEDSKVWCNSDGEGVTTFVVGEIFLILGFIVIYVCCIPNVFVNPIWLIINKIFAIFVFLCSVISHFKCMLSDPGAVPQDACPPSELNMDLTRVVMCSNCNCYKPEGAHHCSTCNRCIIQMDHHCPWVNNCVGILNIKYFFLFLIYVGLLSIYGLATGITRLILLGSKNRRGPPPIDVVFIAFMMVFASVFAIFTVIMAADIIDTIFSGETKIDKKQGKSYDTTFKKRMREVFGGTGSFSLFWFIPTTPYRKEKDTICGYIQRTKKTKEWYDSLENEEEQKILIADNQLLNRNINTKSIPHIETSQEIV
ncbi:hypothetical protein WA158_000246 [Blastocystis sp. Blastoise]